MEEVIGSIPIRSTTTLQLIGEGLMLFSQQKHIVLRAFRLPKATSDQTYGHFQTIEFQSQRI
jgi:hypothetical protein